MEMEMEIKVRIKINMPFWFFIFLFCYFLFSFPISAYFICIFLLSFGFCPPGIPHFSLPAARGPGKAGFFSKKNLRNSGSFFSGKWVNKSRGASVNGSRGPGPPAFPPQNARPWSAHSGDILCQKCKSALQTCPRVPLRSNCITNRTANAVER